MLYVPIVVCTCIEGKAFPWFQSLSDFYLEIPLA